MSASLKKLSQALAMEILNAVRAVSLQELAAFDSVVQRRSGRPMRPKEPDRNYRSRFPDRTA
jgi:hypothetical protein